MCCLERLLVALFPRPMHESDGARIMQAHEDLTCTLTPTYGAQ